MSTDIRRMTASPGVLSSLSTSLGNDISLTRELFVRQAGAIGRRAQMQIMRILLSARRNCRMVFKPATPERLTLAQAEAAATGPRIRRRMSAKRFLGTATSAIWKAT
jgi:hypothetical protein